MTWRIFLLGLFGLSMVSAADKALLTKAESSDYQATSSYAEVVAFCEALAEESPRVVYQTFGQSEEGRALPLLVLSHDGIAEANDRLTVLCVGNIHAGEVCGKEALLMLARDLARAEKPGVLKQLNVLIAPIYNTDGNEKMALDNRPGQLGPEHGMGERVNAHGLDLNRDYVKTEAAETKALLKLLRDWDPEMVIDTHTTNGSHHRYTLTYGGPRHPNTHPALTAYARDQFLPKVSEKLLAKTGYESFYYGNFAGDHERWETYPGLPRYGAHYLGMRHRLGILSEAYAYAPYKDRVLVTHGFVRECLNRAHKQRKKIKKLVKKALEARPDRVVLRHALAPFEEKRVVNGYVEKDGKPTEVEKDYLAEYWGSSKASLEASLPAAYVLPPSARGVVERLQRHGIEVQELREDLDLNVTQLRAVNSARAVQPFQGHHLVTVDAVAVVPKTKRVPAGAAIVWTDQSLGRLAAFLLEPQSEDGFVTWGLMEPDAVWRLEEKLPLLTCDFRPLEEDRERNKKVTFDALYGDEAVDFDGSVTRVEWLDEKHYLQRRDGKWHSVHAKSGKAKPFLSEEKLARSLRAIGALTKEEVESFSKRQSWTMNEARTAGLLEYGDDLYHIDFKGRPACRLTSSPAKEELATFSPDGEYVGFVREGNLCVVDVKTGTERALTTDGAEGIRNGKADWVYFEELYGRSWKAYWWSPDSRRIAFHRFDATRLPMFHALDTLPLHGELKSMRHPKAGDPNPEIQLGIAHVAGGSPKWVDLSGYLAGSYIISHVGWRPEGRIYYYVQDRAQTWLDFRTCSSKGGKSEKWFRDTTEAWVESPGDAHWLKDGVVIASERTGWRHLYRFLKAEKTWAAITKGEWEVRKVHAFDEEAGTVHFTGTKDSHLGENFYRACLNGEGEPERLTDGKGHHAVKLSEDGALFVDAHGDFDHPTRVRLCDGEGKMLRVVDSNPNYTAEEYEFGESQFHPIETEDGFQLEAVLTKPPGFDPEKKYPVWFRTYGGPHYPVVRDVWGRSRMQEQLLANMGLVVFRMDPRSASGKGAVSAWSAYRELGVQEMKDIETAIGWLTEHPFIDADRIGMHGHSYGGFMTAYAMTHSTLFAAGISGAPVTDWHYYDSIYTERYMNTPQENPDGYEKTSVVKAAGDLHGKLLLLHGHMADNVHLQNSTQLVHALQEAGKDFQVMFYPTMKHGLHGKHYDRLLVEFIRSSLALPVSIDKEVRDP